MPYFAMPGLGLRTLIIMKIKNVRETEGRTQGSKADTLEHGKRLVYLVPASSLPPYTPFSLPSPRLCFVRWAGKGLDFFQLWRHEVLRLSTLV